MYAARELGNMATYTGFEIDNRLQRMYELESPSSIILRSYTPSPESEKLSTRWMLFSSSSRLTDRLSESSWSWCLFSIDVLELRLLRSSLSV